MVTPLSLSPLSTFGSQNFLQKSSVSSHPPTKLTISFDNGLAVARFDTHTNGEDV